MIFAIGLLLLLVIGILLASRPLWARGEHKAAIISGVFVVLAGTSGYLLVGSPSLADKEAIETAANPDIDVLVQRLADRLEAEPDDLQGWTMLGRTFTMLGRYDEAAAAFREVVERSASPKAENLLSLAQALVFSDQQALQGEAGDILERVLEMKPEEPLALWFGGLSAQVRGDEELAIERWTLLLEQDIPTSLRQIAEDRLVQADPDALQALVTVKVTIHPDVEDMVPPEGTLFVTLRQPDAPAGTPPLAARRLASFRYPVDIRFLPRDVFNADVLPDGPLQVTARITTSDDALRTAGGLEGSGVWNRESVKTDVTIDHQTQ